MGVLTTLRWVLILVVVSLVGFGVWWVDRRLDTLATLNHAAQTLERLARQENGDLRLERRRLSERLTQAQTTTSARESSLQDALAQLHLSDGLRRELVAQVNLKTSERVGESVGQVTIRDTVTVSTVTEMPEIQTDWIDASIKNGVFAYRLRAEYHYVQVSHVERSGAVRIVESAYLQSVRNPEKQLAVPVVSQFVIRKPSSHTLVWDPTLHLGVIGPAPTPMLAVSLISYGLTRQGQDVLLSGPLTGVTIARRPDLILSPLTVNIGHWLPVLDDVFVTGGLQGRPGQWSMRVFVSTSL